MTAGDVTSRFSDFPVYLCLRLCLVTARHCEELDMTGLDVISPLRDPPLPPRALSLPLFSVRSRPRTLSCDLLRRGHDRCGCHLQVDLTVAASNLSSLSPHARIPPVDKQLNF